MQKSSDYGLVVCGGQSTRMGCDKSLLSYHGRPQRYHLYEMLEGLCEQAFISCNQLQLESINHDYPTLADLGRYLSIGPMASLLTAFTHYPNNDFLVVGCDYPFVRAQELEKFLSTKGPEVASAFYNEAENLYEPTLAWYSHRCAGELIKLFESKQYSLQAFLKSVNAGKYFPAYVEVMTSIDTPKSSSAAKLILDEQAEK